MWPMAHRGNVMWPVHTAETIPGSGPENGRSGTAAVDRISLALSIAVNRRPAGGSSFL
jgi:hypothetical protein